MSTSAEMVAASHAEYEALIRRVHEEAVGLMQAHPEWDVDAANASLARLGAPPLPTTSEYTVTLPIAVSFKVNAITVEQARALGERMVGENMSPERFLTKLARSNPTDAWVHDAIKVTSDVTR